MVFCLAENRTDSETGLKLAILSLSRHCPETEIVVFTPQPSEGFRRFCTGVSRLGVQSHTPGGAREWNCKPYAVLGLFEAGHDEVVWVDSDIVVHRDPRPLLARCTAETFVVAQEPLSFNLGEYGGEARTRAWELPVGRSLPVTLNSCAFRATRAHIGLMKRWIELLDSPGYTRQAELPRSQRQAYWYSDQDALNALLGAREFSEMPLKILRTGDGIVHSGGMRTFSLSDRLRWLVRGNPYFFHAIGAKPWLILAPEWHADVPQARWQLLCQETSPYVTEARRYEAGLFPDVAWLKRRSVDGRILKLLGLGHHALRGLPLATLVALKQRISPQSGR